LPVAGGTLMHVVYAARYRIDIGLHVFPTEKYRQVHDRLLARYGEGRGRAEEGAVIRPADIVEPQPATWDELALVHTREYLAKLREGALSSEEIAQLQLPWSVEMVEGFRLMVGGTIDAACLACGVPRDAGTPGSQITQSTRISASSAFHVVCHIGGGLHHAFANHGEGFCPFNDVAVAIRVLQIRGIERIAVVDLDVHHGNGTAFIFENDSRVFTFSMHQQHNYPMWKPRGSLDIGLPDGVHDATFLAELERALPTVMAARPQCVFYLAGADPYEDDQLGGLRLTIEGLRQRDRRVIGAVARAGVPLVVVLAGGYARRTEDTVAIHVATIEEAISAKSATGRTRS
jgi:acetoin utilization deacetylase AcuC-like enzyme